MDAVGSTSETWISIEWPSLRNRPRAHARRGRSSRTQIVEEKKGWFVANVVGVVVDMELQVEAVLMERLRATLVSEGVSALAHEASGGMA